MLRKSFATMFFLSVALLLAGPAQAHDWYPPECCHELDCAPVDKVEMLPGASMAIMGAPSGGAGPGAMMVTTKHGTAYVPADFPRRASKDNRMHACMRKTQMGTMKLICIFLPPST